MIHEPTLPFQSHSPTSRDAARAVKPTAAVCRQRVLEVIRRAGPLTDEQIAGLLDMNPSTARPRRIELARDGLIVEAGHAKTTSGRLAVTWEAVL